MKKDKRIFVSYYNEKLSWNNDWEWHSSLQYGGTEQSGVVSIHNYVGIFTHNGNSLKMEYYKDL